MQGFPASGVLSHPSIRSASSPGRGAKHSTYVCSPLERSAWWKRLGAAVLALGAAALPLYGVPPANDRCMNATDLGGFVGRVSFNNVEATTGPEGQASGCGEIAHDIWYRWTAPCNGVARFSTAGDEWGQDTVLAVYAGSCAGSVLVCNDDTDEDSEDSLGSTVEVVVTAGQVLIVQVGAYEDEEKEAEPGPDDLFISCGPGIPPPANDHCAGAEDLGTFLGERAFDNRRATTGPEGQDGEHCDGDPEVESDLWYRWRAPSGGLVTLSTVGGEDVDTKIVVYEGGGCLGRVVACNDDVDVGKAEYQSRVTFEAAAGGVFLFQIGASPEGESGEDSFSVAMAAPPLNDRCANPLGLGDGVGVWAFDPSGATTGPEGQGSVACDGPRGRGIGSDLWYSWTAPCTGNAAVSTLGYAGGMDTKIAVYPGDACAGGEWSGGEPIACNDDFDVHARESDVVFAANAGRAYLIQIGLAPGILPGGNGGSFAISCDARHCPADHDGNGSVGSADFFSFLASFFAGNADVDMNGVTDSRDFFVFLGWFFSSPEECAGVLCPPNELAGGALTPSDVRLEWAHPCGGALAFRVLSAVGSGAWSPSATVPGGRRDAVVNGLEPGTTYRFAVVALGRAGASVPSNVVTITMPTLAPPSGCLAYRDNATPGVDVLVVWEDNSGNESGFIVERRRAPGGFEEVGRAEAGATVFRDTENLVVGRRYWYRVRAFIDGPGGEHISEPSNEDAAIARGQVLPAPSDCVAARDDATPEIDVVVTWRDNSADETEFRIARSEDLLAWDNVGVVGANVTSFRDAGGLETGRRYHYKVRAAIRGGGGPAVYSSYSNIDDAIPRPPAIAAPSDCVAARDDALPFEVVVTWRDNSTNETEFRVARSTDGQEWTNVGVTAADATMLRDTGPLQPGRRYHYRVRAALRLADETFFSEYSNVDDAIPRPANIAAPSSCGADYTGSCFVLGWVDNATNETHYRVARSDDGSTWTEIGVLPANSTSFSDCPAYEPGRRYFYRVRAVLAGEHEEFYSEFCVFSGEIPPIPRPTNCTAVRDDATCELDVVVCWEDNSGNEASFRIARSTDEVNWDNVGVVGANITCFRDTSGLQDGVRYFYRVRAAVEAPGGPFYSAYSNIEAAIPRRATVAAPSGCEARRDDDTCEIDVVVCWQDNSDNESGFRISRRRHGSTDWTHIGTVGPNVTCFRNAGGLQPGERYWYRVRAVLDCSDGPIYSEYSNEESAIPRVTCQ